VPRLDNNVRPTKKNRRRPADAQIALDAIKYALDEVGIFPPASNHIPPNIKCVTIKQWRTYFYQKLGHEDEVRNGQKPDTCTFIERSEKPDASFGQPDASDTMLKDFNRCKKYLIAEKTVTIFGTYAWIS
jgi:hypothetical protein